MKCNPWRWLWGLIPILMLGWIAILGEREHIEADLTSRTATVLERDGHSWASVHFEGRDAVLSGRAVDESEPAKAVAVALDTMGVRLVDNRVTLADKAASYEWGATRRDDRIRVNGFVPSDKSRREVIGIVKANFPSLEVDDRMKLARGSPPIDVWLGGVGFGLKQLALLREGRIELENTSIAVSGTARDAPSYRAVKTALSGQMPQGIRLKSDTVRPPPASPYTWSARRHGDELLLAGHVPSEAVHDDLLRSARRVAPKAKIVDRMEPASGAPGQFVEAANAVLVQLGRLEEGDGRLRDKSVTLNGIAETSERADQVKGALKQGILAAFQTNGAIRSREPAIKTITPYRTSAAIGNGKVVLSGYVPDDGLRAALVAMARQRFGDMSVNDQLELGIGQPAGWQRCLEVGFDALQKLGNGAAVLTDRNLAVTGTTETEILAQSLPASIRAEAGPACDTSVRVTLDLAAIQANEAARRQSEEAARQKDEERRRNDEIARLDRERQSAVEVQKLQAQQAEEERRRAEAAARQQAVEERRRADAAARQQAEEDRRRADAAARQQAEEDRRRADAAARQQAEEDRHRADAAARQQAEDDRRRAEAAARQQAEEDRRRADAAARQQAEEERRRADAAARRKAEAERIARLPANEKKAVVDVCQEALSRVVREGIINFNRASYDLDPASYPTLNKVADAANRCPALTVEIEGHTDSEGTPARNKRLADRRANTVREYLSRAGVEPSRLEAIGFGETRPIAANDTPEGRAKNRRIEFIVKLKE
ncbi:MAG: OmpA family protein [Hyphomicrobiaceae bacterium]